LIEDTPETEAQWRALLSAFEEEFHEFEKFHEIKRSDGFIYDGDYSFPDWHEGMRQLFVYLHNDSFYNENFLPRVQRILNNTKQDCFARFECHRTERCPGTGRWLGWFMVFKDNVIFDNKCEETGLIKKLIVS
jgi:hypothetical protein